MNILYTLVPHRIKPNIKKAMFTSNGGPRLLLMDQANTLPPTVGARVLAIAVAVMAMPLTDPAMCAGEELFINNDVAVNEQLVMVFWGMMITNRRVHNKDEELDWRRCNIGVTVIIIPLRKPQMMNVFLVPKSLLRNG